jgi:MFS family permease
MVTYAQSDGSHYGVESAYAWLRLAAAMLLGTIGSVGLWAYVVALPAVQAEFAVNRADAALPYTLCMLGFGCGAVVIGRLADKFGIFGPLTGACLLLGFGFLLSGLAPNLEVFAFAHLLIGLGSSGSFAPLLADISHWFTRRRGVAVALCASGNYAGGAIWPPIAARLIETVGWRQSQLAIAAVCIIATLPLLPALRRRLQAPCETAAADIPARGALRLNRGLLFALLCLAGAACCVAMSMPQVHLVAYCGDLGLGPARGAEMLSLMMGCGLFSRVGSGFVADRIGALATLLAGSLAQGSALCLYLLFDGLTPLYVISALFGLFQGGIVPMYAIIVREYFPPRLAGTLVGLVIMSTILGMAFGGWVSGAIFDFTGSYRHAFTVGLAWNILNAAIVLFLLKRRQPPAPSQPGDAMAALRA